MVNPEFVRFCEQVPDLDAALESVAIALHYYTAARGIDLISMNPETFVTPEGKMVVQFDATA